MNDPLRIGVICHPTYGGSGVVASELALSMAGLGHEVHLFSHEVPPRLARSPGPVQMHVAQGVPYPLFHSTPHDLAITSRALELHREIGLDIIHAHYALPHAVSAILARDAAKHNSDRRPPKVVTTLHGTDITLVGNDPSYAPLTEYILLASDAVTAVSEDLAQRTRENFCTMVAPCSIEVLPNFVDLQEFSPDVGASTCVNEGGVPTAVHVSNFRSVKRVPWLVEAFADACEGIEARLVLVGDGPEQATCRRIAQERGIPERVRFLGERDALPALLAPATVFCLASREESFGLSSLEAMSCGTPVVATRVGGICEVVEEGKSGLLVDLDDRKGYARAMRALLMDPERAHKLGMNARSRAESEFARERVVPRYEALYRRLTSEGDG
jgi:L-malate glycosyltransferase